MFHDLQYPRAAFLNLIDVLKNVHMPRFAHDILYSLVLSIMINQAQYFNVKHCKRLYSNELKASEKIRLDI